MNKRYSIIGWDIGGANIKATKIIIDHPSRQGIGNNLDIIEVKTVSKYFRMWKDYSQLSKALKKIYQQLGTAHYMGLTMTAELSDAFSSKREGVEYIIREFQRVFSEISTYVVTNDQRLLTPRQARQNPLKVAAANWIASAAYISDFIPNVIYTDIGSTTTDIIPIIDGEIITEGKNDSERLSWGELIYLGALRTNLATIVDKLPVKGKLIPITREFFAITADLHLILDYIKPSEYNVAAPDGKGKEIKAAENRIARLISEDRETLTSDEIYNMAKYIFEKELSIIKEGLLQVYSRVAPDFSIPLMATGRGRFLLEAIADRLKIDTVSLEYIESLNVREITTSLGIAYMVSKEVN